MAVLCEYNDEKSGFSFMHSYTKSAQLSHFALHNHNENSEILIFLKGSGVFRVEGSEYFPKPWDIIIANSNEMHKMCIENGTEYERYVINIDDSFFLKNNCSEFMDIFRNRPLGENNLIKADEEIQNVVNKLQKYIQENAPEVVLRGLLVELLYLMRKKADKPSVQLSAEAHIKNVIIYINENIRSPLTLDGIAEKFYINKYYLCHIFRRHTGLSINKYINYKRLLLARELYSDGMSLTDASAEAGFCNYSSFYKVYRREFASSPRDDLKSR